MRIKQILFSVLFVVLMAGPVWGATYYVSTDGNDTTGTGAEDAPWKTWSKIQTLWGSGTITAGGTVYFRYGDDFTGNGSSFELDTQGSGSAGSPVTFAAGAFGGRTSADAKPKVGNNDGYGVDWGGAHDYLTFQNLHIISDLAGFYVDQNADNIIVDGCIITNASPKVTGTPFYFLNITATNWLIKNVSTSGHNGAAIWFYESADPASLTVTDFTVEDSVFDCSSVVNGKCLQLNRSGTDGHPTLNNISFTRTTVKNHPSTMGVHIASDTTGSALFTDCLIIDNGNDSTDDGIFVDATASDTAFTVDMVGCTISGNKGDGVTYHEGTLGTVKNCSITENGRYQIINVENSDVDFFYNVISKTDPSNDVISLSDASSGSFFNNTIYSNSTTKSLFNVQNISGGGTITIKNNIFYGGLTGFSKAAGATVTIVNDFNCFYAYDSDAYTGQAAGASDLTNHNPLFINPAVGDFRLKAASPLRNAGVNLGAGYELDFDGNNQNRYGRGWEIGAYVFKEVSAFGVGF